MVPLACIVLCSHITVSATSNFVGARGLYVGADDSVGYGSYVVLDMWGRSRVSGLSDSGPFSGWVRHAMPATLKYALEYVCVCV